MRTPSSAAPVTTFSMEVMPPTPLMVGMEMTLSRVDPVLTPSWAVSVMTISMVAIPATSFKAATVSMLSTAAMTTTLFLVVKVLIT